MQVVEQMKLSTEIYTHKVEESKVFYTTYFGFEVKLEMDGFVVLQHKEHPAYELMFCIPNSPFVQPIFHPEFQGRGVLFQFEVEDVDSEYERLLSVQLPIVVPLVAEEVNGRHFTVIDPNGILVDIVSFGA